MSDRKFALLFTTILLFVFVFFKSYNLDTDNERVSPLTETGKYLIDFEKKNELFSFVHYMDTSVTKKIAVIKPDNPYGPNLVVSNKLDISNISKISFEQDVMMDNNVKSAVLILSIDNNEGNTVYEAQNLELTSDKWYRTKNTFILKNKEIEKDDDTIFKVYILKEGGTVYIDDVEVFIEYKD